MFMIFNQTRLRDRLDESTLRLLTEVEIEWVAGGSGGYGGDGGYGDDEIVVVGKRYKKNKQFNYWYPVDTGDTGSGFEDYNHIPGYGYGGGSTPDPTPPPPSSSDAHHLSDAEQKALGLDKNYRFTTAQDAVAYAAKHMQSVSQNQNSEYNAVIQKDGSNGWYISSVNKGDFHSVNSTYSTLPGEQYYAVHTHGNYNDLSGNIVDQAHDRWNSNNFSPEDISGANNRYSNAADGSREIGSYLIAPDGTFKLYDPATGSSSTIGNINNTAMPTPTPPQP